MSVWCILMIGVILVLLWDQWMLKRQIRKIDEQLKKRRTEGSRQPIHLQLMNQELNQLVIDINESMEQEEKLRFEVIDREQEFKDMIANISHDLRTPLTSIKGYLQLVDKSVAKGQITKEVPRNLQIVKNHTDELGDLIEHFYEYSYLCDVQPDIVLQRINLTNLVMETVAAMIPQFEERNLEYELSEEIYHIQGDSEMVTRIVQNLLRNCLSYAKSKIQIYYTVKEDQVLLHVQNDLQTMDEVDTKHLFERFYAGTHSKKSTGLGLAIVKLLAGQLGGEVSAAMVDGELDLCVEFQKE